MQKPSVDDPSIKSFCISSFSTDFLFFFLFMFLWQHLLMILKEDGIKILSTIINDDLCFKKMKISPILLVN